MPEENLETNLKKDSNGKPSLDLIPLEKIVVHTPTQEIYNQLMRVYEIGHWISNGLRPATKVDLWKLYKSRTCVDAGINIFVSIHEGGRILQPKFGIWEGKFKFYQRKDPMMERKKLKTISTEEFYQIQKITPEIIKEINKYFE